MLTKLTRWGVVAQAWPRRRAPTRSPVALQLQSDFAAAAYSATYADPQITASAREIARGSENVYRDIMTAVAMGVHYQIIGPDGIKWRPLRYMLPNPTAVLDQITNAVGSMLYRAGLTWAQVAPGNPGEVLQMVGGAPQWGAPPGAPGTAAWSLLIAQAIAAPTQWINVNVSPYEDCLVIFRNVTLSGANFRVVQVSTDGGVTYRATSGDYVSFDLNGVPTNRSNWMSENVSSTLSRTIAYQGLGMRRSGAPKLMLGGNLDWRLFVQSNSPITHIRVGTTTGTMNAGTVYVYAR